MALPYSLVDNPLTVDPKDLRGQVQQQKIETIEQIVDRLVVEGSILKKTESFAVITAFLQALTKNAGLGIGFQSPYLGLYHTISGVFDNSKDSFDVERHQVKLNLRLGKEMKQALQQVATMKLVGVLPAPELIEFYDYASDSTDQRITPGNTAEVSGGLLKVEDPESTEQGVFFVHSDGSEYRVARLRHNTRSKLSFAMPQPMKKGSYRLEVRTTISKSKDIRSGSLEAALQVL